MGARRTISCNQTCHEARMVTMEYLVDLTETHPFSVDLSGTLHDEKALKTKQKDHVQLLLLSSPKKAIFITPKELKLLEDGLQLKRPECVF